MLKKSLHNAYKVLTFVLVFTISLELADFIIDPEVIEMKPYNFELLDGLRVAFPICYLVILGGIISFFFAPLIYLMKLKHNLEYYVHSKVMKVIFSLIIVRLTLDIGFQVIPNFHFIIEAIAQEIIFIT